MSAPIRENRPRESRLGASLRAAWAAARTIPRALSTLAAILLALLLAAAWIVADRMALLGPPPTVGVAWIEIDPVALADFRPVAIGRASLGQRPGPSSAEAAHLGLRFDPERGWLARNLAAERRVLFERADGVERFARRWRLAAGDVVEIGRARLLAAEVAPDRIVFTVARRDGLGGARSVVVEHFAGRGAEALARPLEASSANARSALWLDPVACGAPSGFVAALRGAIDALDLFSRRERLLATIGGGLDCVDRIAAEAPPGALRLLHQDGDALVAPGLGEASRAGLTARFRRAGEDVWTRFAEIEQPLDGVSRIVLGRTSYRPEERASGALRLTAVSGAQRFWAEDAPEGAADPGDPRDPAWRALCADPERRADPQGACALVRSLANAPAGVTARLTPPERRAETGSAARALIGLALATGLGVALALVAHIRFGRLAFRRNEALRLHRGDPFWSAALLGLAATLALAPLLAAAPLPGLADAGPPRLWLGPVLALQWAVATWAVLRAPERDATLLLFWFAMSVVIALGAVCQALLSFGAADDRWLRFDARHAASLSLVLFAVALVASLDMEGPRALLRFAAFGRGWGAWALRAGPIAALALLFLAWVVVGREEGLGGFQPMEAGKFLAVLYFALAAARFHEQRLSAGALARRSATIAQVAGFGLVYLFLFVAAPGLTGDFSPILILALVGALMLVLVGLTLRAHRLVQVRARRARAAPPGSPPRPRRAFAWFRRGAQRPWLESVGAVVALAGLAIAAGLASVAVDHVGQRLDQAQAAGFSIPEQRVAVFLAPERHPDLGAQTHRSRAAIAGAGETPVARPRAADAPSAAAASAEQSLDRLGFDRTPPALAALPAVQDDFIAAFFLNRFGVLAGVALVVAQIVVVWLMLDAALGRYDWRGGDYADDAARQPLCFVTLGGALMLAAHWAIAWSNAFGWGPIMGQPMTWISAGNSHILFMAAPFLLVALTCLRLTPRRPVRQAASHGRAPPPLGR
ncbi:MAG: hypothetical protein AAFW46_01465 [Pseudomonadota bacterium]